MFREGNVLRRCLIPEGQFAFVGYEQKLRIDRRQRVSRKSPPSGVTVAAKSFS
jgi:hypothetical protein